MARVLLVSGKTFFAGSDMIGDIQSYLGVYTQAMSLRTYRQQVLASNIANADTPYYKARDFDFRETFARVRGARDPEQPELLAMRHTHPLHMDGTSGTLGIADTPLLYRTETQSAVDGNTVDMDVERAEITDNSLQYQILSQLLSDKLRGLRTAISGNQG
ncbi:MAG: flagellar basal body rod protein FlgB [Zoogloeaceae bacterium]|jgi:flagellar basal-body rod protein FlgB|nr:flagellar basal body rod protein FlgB [Zoogloeaceae bacterium]